MRVSLWAGALALLLPCAGCGRTKARGAVVIRFSIWGAGPDFKHWQETVRQFNDSQSRVFVDLEHVQGAGYGNKMMSMLVGRAAPRFHPAHPPALSDSAKLTANCTFLKPARTQASKALITKR